MPTLVLVTAVVGLGIGLAVLFANPERFSNQVFAGVSLLMFAIFFSVYSAFKATELFWIDGVTSAVPWLRAGAVLTNFMPWILWMLKESLLVEETDRLQTLRRSLPLVAAGVVLSLVCLTEWYIPSHSLPHQQLRGPAFPVRNGAVIATFIFLVLQTWSQAKKQTGIRRIEFQFFVLNLGIASLVSVALSVASNVLRIPILRTLSFLVVVVAYVVAAGAITYFRIFDVRQVFVAFAQRAGLVLFLGVAIIYSGRGLESILPPPTALFVGAVLVCSLGVWLDRKSRKWLDLDGTRLTADMRNSVIALACSEPHPKKLISKFEDLLRARCDASFATLLSGRNEFEPSAALEFPNTHPGHHAFCENVWVTPERLERQRPSPGSDELRTFLSQHSLGLMIVVLHGNGVPSLIVALGTKTGRWPFTYPEVRRLQDIAELMDNILTRSRVITQAALHARVEHLAMMSRGLAHDLKNLITPISSYLVHTENNVPTGSAEADVHSAAKRSVRIMTDYIREALFFSQRLSPDYRRIDLLKVFDEVRSTTEKRARDRGVSIVFEPVAPALTLTADSVLVQRLLANLISNAIDASRADQEIVVCAVPCRTEWIRFLVSDHGTGIPSENLPRIFDPYFTTKQFGDDVRGFGLGLTICQKIVHLHGGTISVVSRPEKGTTVTVELPAKPTLDAGTSSVSVKNAH